MSSLGQPRITMMTMMTPGQVLFTLFCVASGVAARSPWIDFEPSINRDLRDDHQKIVGGKEIAPYSWPFVVQLSRGGSDEIQDIFCGGGGSPDTPHEVKVTVVSNQQCNSPSAYNGGVYDTNVCAGEKQGGKDSCQGDSGGLFVCTCDSQLVHVGVVSWGVGCAQAGKPGVYSRTSSYVPWINKCLSSNGDDCEGVDGGSGGGGGGGGSGGNGGGGGGNGGNGGETTPAFDY